MIKLEIESRFISTSEAPQPQVNLSALLLETYKPRLLFERAQTDWNQAFATDQAVEFMNKLLAAGNLKDPAIKSQYEQEIEWLSKLRKSGTRFCDAWRFLDTYQKPPKPLKKVVKSIGHFKDAVWSNGLITYDPDILLKHVLAMRSAPEYRLNAMGFLKFLEGYNQRLTLITTLNEKETITLDEHHTLRKAVRSMKHHYGLIAKVTGNQHAKAVERFLDPVSTEMGKAQNLIVEMEARDTIEPEKDLTVINPRHQLIIQQFINCHSSI